MKFSKEFLYKLVYDDVDGRIEDNIVSHSRWSVGHTMIFEFEGKFYRTYYSRGATENQCEEPYEYSSNIIECEEVKKVEKIMKVWEAVK